MIENFSNLFINLFHSIDMIQLQRKEKKTFYRNQIKNKNLNKIENITKNENENGHETETQSIHNEKDENNNWGDIHTEDQKNKENKNNLLELEFNAARTYASLVLTLNGLGLKITENKNTCIQPNNFDREKDKIEKNENNNKKDDISHIIRESSLRIEKVLFFSSNDKNNDNNSNNDINNYNNKDINNNNVIIPSNDIVRQLELKTGNDNGDNLNSILKSLLRMYTYEPLSSLSVRSHSYSDPDPDSDLYSSSLFSTFLLDSITSSSFPSPASSSSSSSSSLHSSSSSSSSSSPPSSSSSSSSSPPSSSSSSSSSSPSSSFSSSSSSSSSSPSPLPFPYTRQLLLAAHRHVNQNYISPEISIQIISSLISLKIWKNISIFQISDTVSHFLNYIDIIDNKNDIINLLHIIPFLTVPKTASNLFEIKDDINNDEKKIDTILSVNFPIKLKSGMTEKVKNEIQILTEILCFKLLPNQEKITKEKEFENLKINEKLNENKNENRSEDENEKNKVKNNRIHIKNEKDENLIRIDDFLNILKALKYSFTEISDENENENENKNSIKQKISEEVSNSLIYYFTLLINDFKLNEIISALNYFYEFGHRWNDFDKKDRNLKKSYFNNENENENENEIKNKNKDDNMNKNISDQGFNFISNKKLKNQMNDNKINNDNNDDNKEINFENFQSTLQNEILKIFRFSNLSNIEFENIQISLYKFGLPKKVAFSFLQNVPQKISPVQNNHKNEFSDFNSIKNDFANTIMKKQNYENDIIKNENKKFDNSIVKEIFIQTNKNDNKENNNEKFSVSTYIPKNIPRNVPRNVLIPTWKNLEELKDIFPLLYENPNNAPNVLWKCYQEGYTVHTLLVCT